MTLKSTARRIARDLCPPIIGRSIATFAGRYEYSGDYSSFDEAADASGGYDTDSIGQKAAECLPMYLGGIRELDERFQRAHSALSAAVASLNKREVHILDVGGANGAHYFVLQPLFPHISLRWTVLETTSTVRACAPIGAPVIFTDEIPGQSFDITIMSGVVQYLREPLARIHAHAKRTKWIIIARVPVGSTTRLYVQQSGNDSMPCWRFSRDGLEKELASLGSIHISWTMGSEKYQAMRATSNGYLIEVIPSE